MKITNEIRSKKKENRKNRKVFANFVTCIFHLSPNPVLFFPLRRGVVCFVFFRLGSLRNDACPICLFLSRSLFPSLPLFGHWNALIGALCVRRLSFVHISYSLSLRPLLGRRVECALLFIYFIYFVASETYRHTQHTHTLIEHVKYFHPINLPFLLSRIRLYEVDCVYGAQRRTAHT